MRILLIQPEGNGGFRHALGLVEPLGLEVVGAALGESHEVDLIDMRLSSPQELQDRIKHLRPHACGISSSFTVDCNAAIELARQVKATNAEPFVFVGGHHPTIRPEDFFVRDIDAVVIGEGETTVPPLMRCLESGDDLRKVPGLALNTAAGQWMTPERALAASLDETPLPARKLVDAYWKSYRLGTRSSVSSVETSRGCPYRCRFCSVWVFYRKHVRSKSPERIIAEISRVKGDVVFITDDNFFSDKWRAHQVASLLRRYRIRKKYVIQARSDAIVAHPDLVAEWRQIGLTHAFLGFEKSSQDELDDLGKSNTVANNERALRVLESRGVEPVVSFIVNPAYRSRDFAGLRQYIRALRIRIPTFSVLTPLPGTSLFEQLKDKLTTADYDLYDLIHPVLPTRLPLETFCEEFSKLYSGAYPPIYLRAMWAYILLRSVVDWNFLPRWKAFFRDWNVLTHPRLFVREMETSYSARGLWCSKDTSAPV